MADKEAQRTHKQNIVKNLYPDVCLVDGEPVPFEIIAYCSDHAMSTVSQDVFFARDNACHEDSRIETVEGNEEGVDGGIKSGVNEGWCRPVDGFAKNVYCNGKRVNRHTTKYTMNADCPDGQHNTEGTCVIAEAQPPSQQSISVVSAEQIAEFERACQETQAQQARWHFGIKNGLDASLSLVGAAVSCPAAAAALSPVAVGGSLGTSLVPGLALGASCISNLDSLGTATASLVDGSQLPSLIETSFGSGVTKGLSLADRNLVGVAKNAAQEGAQHLVERALAPEELGVCIRSKVEAAHASAITKQLKEHGPLDNGMLAGIKKQAAQLTEETLQSTGTH